MANNSGTDDDDRVLSEEWGGEKDSKEKRKLLGEWGVKQQWNEDNNMGNDDDTRGIKIGVNWGRLMIWRKLISSKELRDCTNTKAL